MAIVRYKNQSEFAFLTWMGGYPWTGHTLDMQRFYVFAKTVARYRSKVWLDDQYFERRILERHPHFHRARLRELYWKLCELVEFTKVRPIPTITYEASSLDGIYERGVQNGEQYSVEITEQEFRQPSR